ncbi:geranyl-CoA carboxylase beta subunit [Nannocystis exedens]|uniref:Geranyl-CoA carboxylase beta subunit n=1 Tax=Nannocystis exedens TaxID=54 RepID=A0A1I1VW00_9BACT|nr:carboxyl transferase domain-containing protein [Nannocystis exedens]PCC72881.1 acetyl-CoA carboxylase [Nannocystis exedens]SFD86929.1 geranyl-CoA carboxylase beta subunit [Nannocystis exedens]
MPVLTSRIDLQGDQFQSNRAAQLKLIDDFRAAEKRVRDNSGKQAEKFAKRGQLLPRDRVARLLDRGAPFLELSTLAGFNMHDDDGKGDASGGGCIVGIGVVSGVRCIVSASDSAIKGGAISPMGLRKSLRAQEIALEHKLPIISCVESAGANLLYQAEIFVDGGRVFANMARLSAAGVPQITIVHGSSTAGGAYLPGLSDYVIAVRGQAKVFLAGPPLVEAALGEVATDEELGGAELHATVTGTAEYIAENDAHAIHLARELLANLQRAPLSRFAHDLSTRPHRPPRYDVEDLLGIVPVDFKKPYDVREVIARLVDDSDFFEFKALYGAATVCGHAQIEGHAVGILGNNGPINPDGACKAGQFIQLCCQSGTPLIFLQNTTGYMVGTAAERAGMVKHGSKMIQAVANADVPKLTVILGGSFGAGNYGMCGRSYDPRFVFAWPGSRIAVMGGEQAAKVMEIITTAKFARMGVEPDADAMAQMGKSIKDRLDAESTALYATARLWDDGLIDPRDTRRVLALALAVCREGEARRVRPNTFGVARL